MTEKVLGVENLTKIYPNGKKANDSINIEIREQEIVGIIGPNGAGKTTLIRQVLGLLRPTEGSITLLGKDIASSPDLVHKVIGYVPQAPLFYPAITTADSVRYVLQLDGISNQALEERIGSTLKALDLEHYANMQGYQLSGGIHKAALLAVAWAKQSQLLVLDEPTSMIDILRKQEYWNLIKQYPKEGRSVLLSSHDMNEVKKLCDRIYFLVGGKTVIEGTTGEILQLLKTPVEIEFIPRDPQQIQIYKDHPHELAHSGGIYSSSFEDLEFGVEFLNGLMQSGGVEYLKMEAPSFEKVVVDIVKHETGVQ